MPYNYEEKIHASILQASFIVKKINNNEFIQIIEAVIIDTK